MDIITYTEFNGERANKHYPLRVGYHIKLPREIKERGNVQTADNVFRMVYCCCSIPGSRTYGIGILVSTLYIGSKSRGYRISNDIESN